MQLSGRRLLWLHYRFRVNWAVPLERAFGVPSVVQLASERPSCEEPETTPLVKEQQSRAALPLIVLSRGLMGAGGDDCTRAKQERGRRSGGAIRWGNARAGSDAASPPVAFAV